MYIGTRPFVLRDATDPKQNLQIADSAEILEAVEMRLKEDILREAARYVYIWNPVAYLTLHSFGGLVLTHNEQG